ncbi:MAG TPA: Uma2 family endonuclease [Ktedonobacteraceae bacterium]|nr:Uma2 family endonuclease [Ktedonobacteraceae bacterium]
MEVMHTGLNELNTVTTADWVPGPQQGDWTYEAYAALTEDGECYEIVQGVLVMSPSPEDIHQDVVLEIAAYLREQIKLKRLGRVFTSPFDVVLSPRDVFQPDVLVVLNQHLDRIHKNGVMGAPDLVVEVISPSSKLYDRVNKHMAYERAGILEYWLVDPHNQTIELFALEGGNYYSLGIFHGEQILPSRVVPQMASAAQFFT